MNQNIVPFIPQGFFVQQWSVAIVPTVCGDIYGA